MCLTGSGVRLDPPPRRGSLRPWRR
jgi:hypothetical protein